MAAILASPSGSDEDDLFIELYSRWRGRQREFTVLDRYYNGEQRLRHIGIALPREFQDFQIVVNVPAMAVDEVVARQQLRAFQRSGLEQADPVLREAWEFNNLDSQAPMVHTDARVFGQSLVSVTANPDDPEHPLIFGEDPRQFAWIVDSRRREMGVALKVFQDEFTGANLATLYTRDATVWFEDDASGRGWAVVDRDDHGLGRVPLVAFLNRARTGRFAGRSEMASVIGLTDAAARIMTNMQIGAETHAVPSRWVAGVSQDDFVDDEGRPVPAWEAYFTSIMSSASKDTKFGQFTASDLKNFTGTVDSILSWCAGQLGFPVRFMGHSSVNPPSEGSIVADESRLIRNCETKNTADGAAWCWVMGLHERIRTGEWQQPNSIRALWADPATPTRAQVADASVKQYAAGVLSREGVWDEMGWDEARKDRERTYLAREASDPVTERIMRGIGSGGVGVGAAAVDDAGADRGVGVAGAAQG